LQACRHHLRAISPGQNQPSRLPAAGSPDRSETAGRRSRPWSAYPRARSGYRCFRAATDAACGEGAFVTEGPFWANTGKANDSWWYNESTASRAGLTVAATEADVRQANTNLTTGINNCGFAQNAFNVKGTFQGNTSKFANINPAAQCTGNFPDGQNTVSWGTFDTNHPKSLAFTCYHWHTDANGTPVMDEADTYLGSNRSIVDSYPSPCSNLFDLQSVMTHEWGHAYGLDQFRRR
jgi:hypothetical protein